jgi:hypothetical protein
MRAIAVGWFISSLFSLLSSGCEGEAGGPAAVIRDSAGIRIVENPALAPTAPPLWTVAAEPRVDIGVLEGDEAYQLSQVVGAVRLSDGRIVVANGGSHELRYFDSTGTFLTSAGRKGSGPGEFEMLGSLFVEAGDTVAAYDARLRRISLFAPDGAFVRSLTITFPAGAPSPIGRFRDGSWLCRRGSVIAPSGTETQLIRDSAPLLVFEPTGALRDSIGRFPGPELYIVGQGTSARGGSLPFGTNTATAVAGDRFYAGHTARYEITRYTQSGIPEEIVRLAWTPIPITGDDLAQYKAERLARVSAGTRQSFERAYRDMPFPSTFPAFAGLELDAAGNVWVLAVSRPGDDRRRWTVFSPDGLALGALETPAAVWVREIGRDYVLGTWRDGMDVEHVRLYALRRR